MRISDWSSDVCSSDLQESGPVDLEHIGRKALHADDGMGTLGTGQVLPDTSLQVPPRADRMAPKSLDFGGLGAFSESAFALALEPELVAVATIVALHIPTVAIPPFPPAIFNASALDPQHVHSQPEKTP